MPFAHPDYTIVRELGRGGTATVYLAVQNSLNRRVALKVMHTLAADPNHGERFLREARIVAKLNHPHIVPVYGVGETPDGAEYFMTMEYLPGGSLTQRASELSMGDTLRMLRQICSALAFAHDQGFVHRDVKPDNILFRTPAEALLADFGIARATGSLTHMTMTGTLLGTPDYMSPEQVAGEEVDHRSDLYSLGIVLYELLAGYKPLQGDSVMSTGLQHIVATPLPLPDNVRHFQPLLDRLLAKKPAQRLDTATALASELEALAASWPGDADQPLSSLHSGEAPTRPPLTSTLSLSVAAPARGRRFVAAASAVLVAGAAGVWWLDQSTMEPVAQLAEPAQMAEPPSESARTFARAQDAFRLDEWFGDGPDTALALFRAVLEQDPDNVVASDRLEDMFAATHQRADRAIVDGNLARAGSLITTLRDAWPDDERIDNLDTRLGAAQAAAERQRREREADVRVRNLLAAADTALSAGALVDPPGSSAADLYRQALEVDADNALARAGLANITDRLLNQAQAALVDGAFHRMDERLEQAAAVAPDEPRIHDIREQADQARARMTAQAAERAARASLDQQVEALSSRITDWVEAAEPNPEQYAALSADLDDLLARAPDHVELRSLRSVAVRHAERLGRQPDEEEGGSGEESEDEDRFRFGSF